MKINLLILLITPFLIFSCVPEEEALTSDFEVPLKWANKSASPDWDTSLRKALEDYGEELMDTVPRDISTFSKNYKTMSYNERLNFWAYLVSIMAEKESNFNPDAFYVENFNDASGNKVVSRGLLQLSIESARGYKCPFLDSAKDLHDAEKNLICTVKIMKRWVLQDGVISGQTSSGSWRGGARYWSVLRKSSTLNFFTGFTLKLF
jgi:hypothetical protein